MDGARELKEPSPEGALCSSALVILLINSMLCKYLSWLFKLCCISVYLNSIQDPTNPNMSRHDASDMPGQMIKLGLGSKSVYCIRGFFLESPAPSFHSGMEDGVFFNCYKQL